MTHSLLSLFRHVIRSASTAFLFSNHPLRCVKQLFLVSLYSPLSILRWLKILFQNLFPPMRCFQIFLLFSAFVFLPCFWQTPCHLWIVCTIEMLSHKTQMIWQTLFEYFHTFSLRYNRVSHETQSLHISLNLFRDNCYTKVTYPYAKRDCTETSNGVK